MAPVLVNKSSQADELYDAAPIRIGPVAPPLIPPLMRVPRLIPIVHITARLVLPSAVHTSDPAEPGFTAAPLSPIAPVTPLLLLLNALARKIVPLGCVHTVLCGFALSITAVTTQS